MSFYSRLGGTNRYGGFGDAILDAMTSAMAAAQAAEAKLAAATARADAAKAAAAKFKQLESEAWWTNLQRAIIAESNGKGGVNSASYVAPEDRALFDKYLPGFPPDEVNGQWDFTVTNQLVFDDQQRALDDKRSADAAVTAAGKELTAAKATLVKTQDAQLAAVKKVNEAAEAAIKKAAADAVQRQKDLDAPQVVHHAAEVKPGLSPTLVAAIAVPLLGLLVFMMTRKKSAVAGYRRRRR